MLTACTKSEDLSVRGSTENQVSEEKYDEQVQETPSASEQTQTSPAEPDQAEPAQPALPAPSSNCDSEAQPEKDDCYTKLAQNTSNSAFCDKISDSKKKNYCYSNLILRGLVDAELCNRLSETFYYKELCYSKLAEKNSDPGFCDKISDISIKDTCFDVVARAREDANLCDKLSDSYAFKPTCYSLIAAKKQDVSICNKIQTGDATSTPQENKDDCLAGVAWMNGDINICERIVTQSSKDHCYSGVARMLNNSDICLTISTSLAKASCLATVAIRLDDPSICQKGSKTEIIDDCYSTIVMGTKNNIALCDNIRDESKRRVCKLYA
ncbi:hypothetical protein AYK26_01165 [Euryarchaeota archaeon SM23-78]|nr:MAG: hypothetical protein AYK26_01165 [Euryarchaeota archaeon SM23-78]